MSFVTAFLEHTRLYESPESYWRWAAYAAIAGVLRDNLYMEDGDSRLYPNVYILFIAGSAQRKGRPVNDAELLVHSVNNVKVISGRSSIQAILIEIGDTETDKKGRIKKGGAAIFFAPELSAGIVQDDQSIQILTDIYDYKATGHTTNLIGRGKSKLDKLVFSMLAASNEELLKSVYTSKAIHGGLLGRTFLVVPNEFRPGNAFPLGNKEGFKRLIDQLREISLLNGVLKFEDEAKETYTEWYLAFREQSRKKADATGILGRLHTNVKKLAIILAANDLSICVRRCHIEQAIDECLALIPNYSMFVMASGKSTIADAGAIILEQLVKAPEFKLGRRVLIRDNWMHFDPDVLDKTTAAFETAGIIRTLIFTGGEPHYQLTEKGLEILGRKQEGTGK